MKKSKKVLKTSGVVLIILLLFGIIFFVSNKKESVETIKLTYGNSTNVSKDYNTYSSYNSLKSNSSAKYSESTNGSGFDIATTDEIAVCTSDSNDILDDSVSSDSTSSLTKNKKLKKTYNYTVESTEFDTFTKEIESSVDSLGGYVESVNKVQRTENNMAGTKTYTVRRATYQIRVPADKATDLFKVIEGKAYIVSQTEGVDDVTTQYIDLDTHITSLKTEYDKLNALLEEATSLSDIIEIQDRLSNINYEIESYEQTLDALKEDIDFSKLNLTVDEVIYYQDTVKRFTSDIAESWYYVFEEWLSDVLPAIVLVTISLIPMIIFIGLALYLVSKVILKNKSKYQQVVLLKQYENEKSKESN